MKIKVFGQKIGWGKSVDLLKISYVSEADIKNSLLKGELSNKIKVGALKIVYSDIDLLQFNLP